MLRAILKLASRDWIVGAACLAGTLWTYQGDMGFSHRYHADEEGKIRQLVSGEWNFHHPLLLLGTTRVALAALGVSGDDDPQSIAVVGRRVAALFAGAAAGLLAAAVCRVRGPGAGWFVVPLLWFHPKTAYYAHFLKEDPALLFGVAGCLYVAARFFERGRWRWLVACGAFAGIAASAKYVGALAPLVLAALVATVPPIAGRYAGEHLGRAARSRAGALLGIALAVFLALNAPLAWRAASFRTAIKAEWTKTTDASRLDEEWLGERKSGYANLLVEPRNERLTLLWGAYAALLLVPPWRRRNGAEFFALAWLGLYLAAVFWAAKTADRYLLPHYFLVIFFGALGLADATGLIRRLMGDGSAGRIAAYGIGIAAVAQLYPAHIKTHKREMARLADLGGRLELIEFARHRLPHDAVIAYVSRVGLIDPVYPGEYAASVLPLPQRVIEVRFFKRTRLPNELADHGVTHVILTEKELGRDWPRKTNVEPVVLPLLKDAKLLYASRGSAERSAFFDHFWVFQLAR